MSGFTLRLSAYLCVLCVKDYFNAEDAEIRREPQSKAGRCQVAGLLESFESLFDGRDVALHSLLHSGEN